ncbi:uncharacterized protein LOC105200506 [Solenopsis invicta]|uniref:uncharacterized protein LOC105200506 n=1 Tax=Solenopsis invicta TaxID=13686 RepID=UPI0005960884|nr:uncharacterized protein LOC105200506 [Solenopsis invicta]XP_011166388.1 uncharacterized protein LOC105200506 [Solenopsis invicta]XP_011166389.1 uncharacterized protein LOC105200506 [Solenopsis invicta]
MQGLRCVGIIDIVVIGIFCTRIAGATGQDMITSTTNPASLDIKTTETFNEFKLKAESNNCKCFNYDCGCCQHLKWDEISMDGILCANASYLVNDYGISLTLTFNDFTIINETVSARNPPPICFGEDIVDALDIEICLHIYDIHIPIKNDKFRACFEILGKIMKLKITKIHLGCVQTELSKKTEYVKNEVKNNLLPFFRKITKINTPSVIMV